MNRGAFVCTNIGASFQGTLSKLAFVISWIDQSTGSDPTLNQSPHLFMRISYTNHTDHPGTDEGKGWGVPQHG